MKNRGSRPLKAKLRPTLYREQELLSAKSVHEIHYPLVRGFRSERDFPPSPLYSITLFFIPLRSPNPTASPSLFRSLSQLANKQPLQTRNYFPRTVSLRGHVRGGNVSMDVYGCLCRRVPVLERMSDAPTYSCDLRFSTAFATLSAERSADQESVARSKRATPPAFVLSFLPQRYNTSLLTKHSINTRLRFRTGNIIQPKNRKSIAILSPSQMKAFLSLRVES